MAETEDTINDVKRLITGDAPSSPESPGGLASCQVDLAEDTLACTVDIQSPEGFDPIPQWVHDKIDCLSPQGPPPLPGVCSPPSTVGIGNFCFSTNPCDYGLPGPACLPPVPGTCSPPDTVGVEDVCVGVPQICPAPQVGVQGFLCLTPCASGIGFEELDCLPPGDVVVDCGGLQGPYAVSESGDWPPVPAGFTHFSLAQYQYCRGPASLQAELEGFLIDETLDDWSGVDPIEDRPGISVPMPIPAPASAASGPPNMVVLYSLPSAGHNKPGGDCQATHMSKTAKMIAKQINFDDVLWACLGNNWTYQTSQGDPRESADRHFRNNLSLGLPLDAGTTWNFAMAWVHEYSNNGVAAGRTALGAETRPGGKDWPHYSIAMHEIGHLFGANDYKNHRCAPVVMNYCGAAAGYMWYDKDNMPTICNFFQTCVAV